MPADHDLAQDYVRAVLGQDNQAPEPILMVDEAAGIESIQQDLSQEENAFLAQALEKMIEKDGEMLEREYFLEDEISGIRYRATFALERIRSPELAGQGAQS